MWKIDPENVGKKKKKEIYWFIMKTDRVSVLKM